MKDGINSCLPPTNPLRNYLPEYLESSPMAIEA